MERMMDSDKGLTLRTRTYDDFDGYDGFLISIQITRSWMVFTEVKQ